LLIDVILAVNPIDLLAFCDCCRFAHGGGLGNNTYTNFEVRLKCRDSTSGAVIQGKDLVILAADFVSRDPSINPRVDLLGDYAGANLNNYQNGPVLTLPAVFFYLYRILLAHPCPMTSTVPESFFHHNLLQDRSRG